jgi:hypothetical protein
MAAYEVKDMSGSAFKNKYKTQDKHPSYTGSVRVDGEDYKLAVWIKVDRNGEKFLSCSFQKADQDNRSNSSQRQIDTPIDLDDDIAF